MAARMVVPACAAAASWTVIWIGPFYAAVLALWTCWVVVALSRHIPTVSLRLCREAAYGERIWLNQLKQTKAQQGPMLGLYLTAWTALGVTILGGLLQSPLVTVTGVIVAVITQFALWKQLSAYYSQNKTTHPLYRFWDARKANDNNKSFKGLSDGHTTSDLGRQRQRPSVR
ncbi:hypothetical protein SADFL11_4941 [Roseibium alexandrii DFL-11]|uniref:Uncharacterized protein n=2 Tax=Roseibium alexandrii TaxID=388408 RepID=A0A5E8H6H0_ROSAD|nr:hypothetical protein SADFL11_4941 [Roseibium alexandrii DFL-11]